MRRIAEISDKDVGVEPKKTEFKPRTAARAVLFNNGRIALLHVKNHQYYKLPGGGVENEETIQQALQRELLEETGCIAEIREELGEIIEHRSFAGIVQTSHCFTATVLKEGNPHFTPEEIKKGFELIWVPLQEAISLLNTASPSDDEGKFIVKRDLYFLQKAA